ncbi:N-6 DNA methylase [Salmonella enterica]|uniref:N-6 DNA methylase n=1 Tax=Salmonella enterica TaxID=28901 RepID=A0A5Y2ZXQ7_SALER|nr:SAM-dependent DNA methyltransferase [Salmonella enterica]EAS0935794.1 SAM-dependent DNA methyltransferase [Salmonella enterica]EAT9250842.1 SAM-dependent DNA methyltransferase [Salmonella enterica]EAV7952729.1 SAM-dependent DNA methyltransferase [Salmonella enterica]EAV9264988.1 SAM-dependent DNA methyltransferase [Salmonella enterica]
MKGVIDHEKAFISLFNQTARYHHRHQVFEDFVSCSVIALHNALSFCEKREQKYLRIVARYEKTDVSHMAQLLAHVVNGLEEECSDFLGRVFMQLELGDKYRGQFFTPWSVGRMMASLQLGDVRETFREKPFITLREPACGAGCMVLAFADVLREAGYAPHRYLWVSATDIDPLAAGMTYIQLSLCGIAGEVVIGNSLNDERRRVLLTPGHYMGSWSRRMRGKSPQAV